MKNSLINPRGISIADTCASLNISNPLLNKIVRSIGILPVCKGKMRYFTVSEFLSIRKAVILRILDFSWKDIRKIPRLDLFNIRDDWNKRDRLNFIIRLLKEEL